MTDLEYEEFARSRWFNHFESRDQPESSDCIAAALGLAGETGEVCDLVKKFIIHGRGTDLPKLVLELGDVEYYLARLRSLYGVTRAEVLEANVLKLNLRYPKP